MVQELTRRGIRVVGVERGGRNFMAYCFRGHDSKTASLSIHRTTGAFYCFGCKVKGPNWNALAEKIGAQQLGQADLGDPFHLLAEQMSLYLQQRKPIKVPWDLQPWDRGPWRGLSESFLRVVGARHWYDDAVRADRIWFPINQYGELVGWVSRRLDHDPHMKYRNATGMPSKEILYPLDVVAHHLDTRTIVLVEGPVDALRLVHDRVSALAILGTNNFDPSNLVTILNLGCHKIVIAMDNGQAGMAARQEIAGHAEQYGFDISHFYCPIVTGPNGPTDTDPGDMPAWAVQNLQQQL